MPTQAEQWENDFGHHYAKLFDALEVDDMETATKHIKGLRGMLNAIELSISTYLEQMNEAV